MHRRASHCQLQILALSWNHPVMTFLFGSDLPFRKKLQVIAKVSFVYILQDTWKFLAAILEIFSNIWRIDQLAVEHASNLAAFAFSYKVRTPIYLFCFIRHQTNDTLLADFSCAESGQSQDSTKLELFKLHFYSSCYQRVCLFFGYVFHFISLSLSISLYLRQLILR